MPVWESTLILVCAPVPELRVEVPASVRVEIYSACNCVALRAQPELQRMLFCRRVRTQIWSFGAFSARRAVMMPMFAWAATLRAKGL